MWFIPTRTDCDDADDLLKASFSSLSSLDDFNVYTVTRRDTDRERERGIEAEIN